MSWRIYRIRAHGKPLREAKRLAEGIAGADAEAALTAFHAEFPWYQRDELHATQLTLVEERADA